MTAIPVLAQLRTAAAIHGSPRVGQAARRSTLALGREGARKAHRRMGRRDHQRDSRRADRLAAPGGSGRGQRGTEVHVRLKSDPPADRIGVTVAWLLGHEPSQVIREDLRRLLKVGDRVVVPFTIACGGCFFCGRQLWSLCDNSNPNAVVTSMPRSARSWRARSSSSSADRQGAGRKRRFLSCGHDVGGASGVPLNQ